MHPTFPNLRSERGKVLNLNRKFRANAGSRYDVLILEGNSRKIDVVKRDRNISRYPWICSSWIPCQKLGYSDAIICKKIVVAKMLQRWNGWNCAVYFDIIENRFLANSNDRNTTIGLLQLAIRLIVSYNPYITIIRFCNSSHIAIDIPNYDLIVINWNCVSQVRYYWNQVSNISCNRR